MDPYICLPEAEWNLIAYASAQLSSADIHQNVGLITLWGRWSSFSSLDHSNTAQAILTTN
jgi:hypothetical protein